MGTLLLSVSDGPTLTRVVHVS